MSNPYAPPQATSKFGDAKTHANDSHLRRLRFRLRVCGIVIGLILIPLGLAVLWVASVTSHIGATFVLGGVGATLTGVGVFACLRQSWPVYLTAAFAGLWLGFLAISLLGVSSVDEPQRFRAILIIRIMLGTPTVLLLLVAAVGIWIDRLIRRRSTGFDHAADSRGTSDAGA